MYRKRIISLMLFVVIIIVLFSIKTNADPVIGTDPTATPAATVAATSVPATGSATAATSPSGGQPGSVDDPMVSKSYVDEQVAAQVAAQVASQVTAQVTAQINKHKQDLPTGAAGNSTVKVVVLATGQTLMASAGSEFIVRTGTALAFSKNSNGIPDVTGGKDIAAKTVLLLNHLLIFPDDTRGIVADPKKTTPIYVMVRGGYTVLNPDGTIVPQ